MKKFIFLRIPGLSQLLTLFLLGVTSSVSAAYGLTLLQFKTANSELNIPVSLQPQAFSSSEGGKNVSDTKVTFDSLSIKTVQSLNLSFKDINWSTVAPSPIARTEAGGTVVEGKLYLFGGYIDTTYTPTRRSDVYNPATNTWTRITDLPIGLTHSGTAVDGRDIYLAGGYPAKLTGGQRFATREVWKYNVDTNTWTAMAPLPEARGGGALELLGRELHFFGGSDINRADKGDHWVLSLDSGTVWTLAAPLPKPRNHLAGAVLDGKLYAIGGQVGQKHYGAQAGVHMWEPAKPNTWTAVASLPKALSHISASTFVMDNRIIVAGGMNAQGSSVSNMTAYDPLSNSWTAFTPLPAARHSGVAGSIKNQIFYTTGGGFKSTTYKGVPVLIFPSIVSDSAIPNLQKTPSRPLTN